MLSSSQSVFSSAIASDERLPSSLRLSRRTDRNLIGMTSAVVRRRDARLGAVVVGVLALGSW
jgi:hypothetical protein